MRNKELTHEVADAFRRQSMPSPESLVVFDGYDELEKESAVAFFSNKSRAEIAETISDSTEGLEELFVLEEAALHYYLQPYLMFLVSEHNAADSDWSSQFAFTLGEILRVKGANVFSSGQIRALSNTVEHLLSQLGEDSDDEWVLSVGELLQSCKERLRA